MRGLKPHLLISRTKLALHHDTDEHCFDAQKECSLYKAYSTRKDGNIDALQLAGRPTSRQSVWAVITSTRSYKRIRLYKYNCMYATCKFGNLDFLSGSLWILWRLVGICQEFGHIVTAHAQKLLFPRFCYSDIAIRFGDPDFLNEKNISETKRGFDCRDQGRI